jgi:hypothetical protein
MTEAVTDGLSFEKVWLMFQSLFKIWNFGVANAKILPCRLQKSRKPGFLRAIDRKNPQY